MHIRPRGSWFSLDLADIWSYRELLYFLTLRDIKVRYKQTAIGVFWAILQPALTTLIFAVVFKDVANFASSNVPYPLFVLSGLLVWLYVNNTISFSATSIVGNSPLVTKIYFPRLMMPLASVFAGLIELVIGLVILLAVMIFYGVRFTPNVLLSPLFLILAIVLAVGVGTLTSALNVQFRDVKFALPFALQIWMFSSPIFYPTDILSDSAKRLISFNPMTGILSGFRSALFDQPFDWSLIWKAVAGTTLILLVSILVFKHMEDDFADVI
ncbi:MAG TPA: ABC transporter permease [Pyrinomonadaceae bacterium]|nr:ABC transporter permease [Pyrinomonadaceae bacterium]